MSSAILVTRIVAILGTASVLALIAPPARADYDKPGPPAIKVEVKLKKLVLGQDQDDGIDGNCELLLAYSLVHVGHGKTSGAKAIDDLNWDTTDTWDIEAPIWEHIECTPRNTLELTLTLTELDKLNASEVLFKLAESAGNLGAKEVAGGVGILGALALIHDLINGDDALGTMTVNLADGINHLALHGADGDADIDVEVIVTPLPDDRNCDPDVPPPSEPTPDPGQQSNSIFDPILDSLQFVPGIDVEPGNPADLQPSDLDETRATYLAMALGTAEATAGRQVQVAAPYAGVEPAIQVFQVAQQIAQQGDIHGAVSAYKQAFYLAAFAIQQRVPDAPDYLLFQAVVSPSYMTMERGMKFRLLHAALGTQPGQPVNVTLQNLPPGMTGTVVPHDLQNNLFELRMDTTNASPGTHMFTVHTQLGVHEVVDPVTVVIHASRQVGDVNNDGCVDDDDLTRVVLDFDTPGGANGDTDVDDSGLVDDADLTIVILHYGEGC